MFVGLLFLSRLLYAVSFEEIRAGYDWHCPQLSLPDAVIQQVAKDINADGNTSNGLMYRLFQELHRRPVAYFEDFFRCDLAVFTPYSNRSDYLNYLLRFAISFNDTAMINRVLNNPHTTSFDGVDRMCDSSVEVYCGLSKKDLQNQNVQQECIKAKAIRDFMQRYLARLQQKS